MIDRVSYDVGWAPIGGLAQRGWVDAELQRIFNFRARRVEELFSQDCAT